MTDPIHGAATARPGDIAMFRFPLNGSDAIAKARHCLIIARQNGAFGPRLTLAYGTSADTSANRGLDLEVATAGDWPHAGLHRPSRFVLSRRLTVSAHDTRFDRGSCSDPTIGRLPRHLEPSMEALIHSLGKEITRDYQAGPPPTCGSTRSQRRTIWRRGRFGQRAEVVIIERSAGTRLLLAIRRHREGNQIPSRGSHLGSRSG
ncbi:hypothetical protein [uncultured Paracoccus sp.]|uniref:hypothetical protein n=1 Tax=uncultured Paracoccus sp. TaxID=189685 RepID=UPI002605B0C6|nr:hypothetical protein [uncultured Paracoccus sp.]